MSGRPKIYVLYQSKELSGYEFVALAKDGTCLSSWVSASQDEARSEAESTQQQQRFANHYPKGYELVWRGGPIDPDSMRDRRPKADGSAAFIEGQLYSEFLRALTL